MEDGPPIFRQDSTCPALLIELTAHALLCTGLSPSIARLSTRFHYHTCGFTLGAPHRSLAATGGISVDFFSSGYLDVSVPPVRLINLWIQLMIV